MAGRECARLRTAAAPQPDLKVRTGWHAGLRRTVCFDAAFINAYTQQIEPHKTRRATFAHLDDMERFVIQQLVPRP